MTKLFYSFWSVLCAIGRGGSRLSNRISAFSAARIRNYPVHVRADHEKSMIKATVAHNMVLHQDEEYYRNQYWHYIREALDSFDAAQDKPVIIDLGCGQGRFTFDLARWCASRGGKVTGVDISPHAIEFARKTAGTDSQDLNIDFIESDLLSYLRKRPSASCSMVICTEVLYMVPEYLEVLQQVSRVLKPDGVFVGGFRSRYFNILHAVKGRAWQAVPVFMHSGEGFPWGPVTKFSWFSSHELERTISSEGFAVSAIRGIGVCSGIEGDPLAEIARPSSLTADEQRMLAEVELELAGEFPDSGRYLLVIARKL